MFNRKCALAFPLVLALSLPAFAGFSKNVTQEDALDGRVPVVVAAEGGGTILDFSETQETIKKVTIDDPSKVIVDYTSPLPVVRLFRGNIPAGDIPSVQKTQLTVVTQDSDKGYHTYIFSVTPSIKPAIYTKFVVGGVSRMKLTGVLASASSGATQAQRQQTLVDPQLKGRVRKYLQLTQAGMSERKAAKRAGISMALVQRLAVLGQGSVQVAQSLPTAQPSLLPVPVGPVPTSRSVAPTQPIEPPKMAQVLTPASVPKPSSKHKRKSRHDKQALSLKVVVQAVVAKVPERQPNPQSIALSDAKAKPAATVVPTKLAIAKVKPINHQTYANALLRGLVKARIDGKIRYGSNKWYSVNNAIRILRRDGSLSRAISVSGMKKDGFMKLLSDGGLAV
jgi:hypothetical protein